MKIVVIGSSGGHLTELLRLSDMLQQHETIVVTYDLGRVVHPTQYNLPIPPFTPMRILRTCWMTLQLLRKEKPDVILSTGAELAIPAFLLSRILRIKTIFLETVTRFKTPTLSGRICYYLSDVFLVQQPELLDVYGPRAKYEGAVL
ncbi:MAG: capsular biosynthesis protein [Phycisphaerae bacterium]|nr:capsular biosynthesis protein [Phycisphaerae bacterium]